MNSVPEEEQTLARLSTREIELIVAFRKADRAYQDVIQCFATTVAAEHPFYGLQLPANVLPFRLR